MAAHTVSAPLSAEPSLPEERRDQHLEAKSYVEAVRQLSDGTNEQTFDNAINNQELDAVLPDGHADSHGGKANSGPSILRIVNPENETQIPSLGQKEKQNGDPNTASLNGASKVLAPNQGHEADHTGRHGIELEEVKQVDSNGIDESSRNRPRQNHDKTQRGESDVSKNSTTTSKNDDVFERFQEHSNGAELFSVKALGTYDKKHERTDKEQVKVDRDNRTLVSGRQAGKGWERSGIRFAPLNVPLQRRLQTLVVLFHSTTLAFCVSFFFFLCAIPLFWPLLIVYMIHCMSSNAATSGKLTHRSNFLRSLQMWSLFASYFPARLHRSEELPPTRKYIFGYHPHGIISHGGWAAFSTEALGFSQLFPGITNTLLTLDSNFRIPIYRDYILAMGMASVSRESCENLLSKGGKNNEGMGRAITIVIGGAAESLDAQPYYMRLVLKRRKGFVKMALRTGADLVPVLAFGENDLYDQVTPTSHPSVQKVQLLIKKMLGFTIPLFHARGVFNYDVGLMPYRRPLNIVVGRPIKVTQNVKPEQEEIDRLHSEYVRELEIIWNLWKDDFAKDRKGELEILE